VSIALKKKLKRKQNWQQIEMSRKSKVKWTDQMNEDLLECKRKAQELITSSGAPVNGNGRKRDT